MYQLLDGLQSTAADAGRVPSMRQWTIPVVNRRNQLYRMPGQPHDTSQSAGACLAMVCSSGCVLFSV